MARKSFDIVGGGFSGMALAWYLSGQGAKVALYEASEKLGGLLDSLSTGYGLIEQAANGLLASQDVEELLADLRLRPLPSKRLHPARYIFRGQPQRLPLQGLEWWALLRLFKAKLGRFQSLTPEQGESLYAWSWSWYRPA